MSKPRLWWTVALFLLIVASSRKPFDFAQAKPFDSAQGKPFDFAQAKPFDSAQGKPLDFARGKHDAGTDEARAFCGTACHAFPPPDILPRAAWRGSVVKMERFRQGNFDPQPIGGNAAAAFPLADDMRRVLRYYEAHAPERLPDPEPWPAVDEAFRGRFTRRALSPRGMDPTPAISSVRLVDLDGDARLEIVATDMRHGLVLSGRPYQSTSTLDVIGDVAHPAHAELTDLDRDGTRDLVIADLGEFFPGDHQKGAVVWLRGLGNGRFASYDVGGFARVADVQAADLDGDSDLDLLVAAFGLWKVGQIALLENRTTDYAHPSFTRRQIDARPGAIHVPAVDLNRDGRLDVVALISQQYETVVAFLGQGPGRDFRAETIYAAPHPNWGSSAMQVVDLDADGDLDVIVANGDTFDDQIVKPYHGIQWLENEGRFPFTVHRLAGIPGVQHVAAADLDGDGDLDILASALLATGAPRPEAGLPSVVWLEQTRPRRFEKRTLEVGIPYHAAFDAADYDGDGDGDLVVGNFAPSHEMPAWIEIWENVTKAPPR